MRKMLIIEDEYKLADMLRDWFSRRDFQVTICTNGTEGYGEAMANTFDIIILDVMLPGMDGFQLLEEIRKNGRTTPVLILTARSRLDDKLRGLTGGAEDYLTKPFSIEELDARVNILSRKAISKAEEPGEGGTPSSEVLTYRDLRLDRNSYTIFTHERAVQLTAKEYTLMEYFIRNAERLLSKRQITEAIWGYDSEIEYNNEEVYISFLRKKLKFVQTEAHIVTIRGAGYKLTGESNDP